MKKLLIILLSLLLIDVFSQQIVQAEYFFDSDPGYEMGTNLNISSSDEIEIDESIDVSGLSPGFHTVFFRFKDENEHWSTVYSKAFFIEKNHGQAIAIDNLEYFYDEDPGYGNGWNYTDFTPSSNLEEVFFAEVSGLTEGLHQFNMRLRNELGQWSQTYSQEFELLNCDLQISGMVTHEDQSSVSDAKIILFQYFGEGAAVGVDTIPITDGSYLFEHVCPMSQYFLKVIPESTSDYPPCYFGNTMYWQEASMVTTEQSSLNNIDIIVYDFAEIDPGSSSVGGMISYADSKGQPVKNVDVILEYDAPDDKEYFEAVAYERSNNEGLWTINNLPNGAYRIKVEIPGLEMDTTYYVNIEAENTVIEDLNFYVDMMNGIYIDYFGIQEFPLNDAIVLFPNPVLNQNFRIQSQNESVKIEQIIIFNYTGQLIHDESINANNIELNSNSWSDGFYLLQIKTNKGVLIKKLIVQ